jgi:putative transposase
MPNYPRVRDGRTHLFTVVAQGQSVILCDPPVRRALRESMIELKQRRPFRVNAWVLLPDRIHCIWTMPEDDHDHAARWRWLRRETTKRARAHLLAAGSPTDALWERSPSSRHLKDTGDFLEQCERIHHMPVRLGLARHPAEWPWSTVHRFIADGIYPVNWGRPTRRRKRRSAA